MKHFVLICAGLILAFYSTLSCKSDTLIVAKALPDANVAGDASFSVDASVETNVGTCEEFQPTCDTIGPECPTNTTPGHNGSGCFTGYCIPDQACDAPGEPGLCFGNVACDEAPPNCPTGTKPGLEDLCYTGYCIPDHQCELGTSAITFRLTYAAAPPQLPNEIYVESDCIFRWLTLEKDGIPFMFQRDCSFCKCGEGECRICDCAQGIEPIAKGFSVSTVWDGTSLTNPNDRNCQLSEPEELPAGQYTARFCYLFTEDGQPVCAEVPFEYPSQTIVELRVTGGQA